MFVKKCNSQVTSSTLGINGNNEKFILRFKMQKIKLRGACYCRTRMTRILRYVAEAFPPARQGTILNNHRVIGIATNTSTVLNCALVTYLMMTAEVGLPDVV